MGEGIPKTEKIVRVLGFNPNQVILVHAYACARAR